MAFKVGLITSWSCVGHQRLQPLSTVFDTINYDVTPIDVLLKFSPPRPRPRRRNAAGVQVAPLPAPHARAYVPTPVSSQNSGNWDCQKFLESFPSHVAPAGTAYKRCWALTGCHSWFQPPRKTIQLIADISSSCKCAFNSKFVEVPIPWSSIPPMRSVAIDQYLCYRVSMVLVIICYYFEEINQI